MASHGSKWSREETLLAFALYCELPFGRLHQHNPQIVALSQAIGRTPSAVAMKACNFASLDPSHTKRGISGLKNASNLDRAIWDAFVHDSTSVVDEIDAARLRLHNAGHQTPDPHAPIGPSESATDVRIRRHQQFFRTTILSTYDGRCALTDLATPELLVASHIIPWATSSSRRCDPTNGICLNALHDRAFDRGLLTFDDDYKAVVSPALLDDQQLGAMRNTLQISGRPLRVPDRFRPDRDALQFHREHVFVH